jgi:hypothetical protein
MIGRFPTQIVIGQLSTGSEPLGIGDLDTLILFFGQFGRQKTRRTITLCSSGTPPRPNNTACHRLRRKCSAIARIFEPQHCIHVAKSGSYNKTMVNCTRLDVMAWLACFRLKSGTNARQEHSVSGQLSAIAAVGTVLGHHPPTKHPDPDKRKRNVHINAGFDGRYFGSSSEYRILKTAK